MIPLPTRVRVWIAAGHTDIRRGMQSLALQVQEALKRDPHAGDLYVFRGRRGDRVSWCILLQKPGSWSYLPVQQRAFLVGVRRYPARLS